MNDALTISVQYCTHIPLAHGSLYDGIWISVARQITCMHHQLEGVIQVKRIIIAIDGFSCCELALLA